MPHRKNKWAEMSLPGFRSLGIKLPICVFASKKVSDDGDLTFFNASSCTCHNNL
jgi:hypothetical protein